MGTNDVRSWCIVITLCADWQVFLPGRWDHSTFITNYFGLPFFLVLVVIRPSYDACPNLPYLTGSTLATNSSRKRGLFVVRTFHP